MGHSNPRFLTAGDRESGVPCQHCHVEVRDGDQLAVCSGCGAVHHQSCWRMYDGCGSYDCAPSRRKPTSLEAPSLRITSGELAAAAPLQPVHPAVAVGLPAQRPVKYGFNRTALAALVVALLGIPLFGVITGLVAIVLGSIALGAIHNTRQRGTAVALAGLLLGIADVVGWLVFLSFALTHPGPGLSIREFDPDPAAVEGLAPHIRRAMKANVMIETTGDWSALGAAGLGSGVVVGIRDGDALIVTNRHVVDPGFSADRSSGTGKVGETEGLRIKFFGQPARPGRLVWTAPDGIDLALVRAAAGGDDVQPVPWREDPELVIGAEVFAIGNPHGLGWTHTQGVISQLRFQQADGGRIRVIQTSAAINPGNSGGGLYDMDGNLIGINTWTNDKRVSEGLSFAIAFDSLLGLEPPLPGALPEDHQPDRE